MLKVFLFTVLMTIRIADEENKPIPKAMLSLEFPDYTLTEQEVNTAATFRKNYFPNLGTSQSTTIKYTSISCFRYIEETMILEKYKENVLVSILPDTHNRDSKSQQESYLVPLNLYQYAITKFYIKCAILKEKEQQKIADNNSKHEYSTVNKIEITEGANPFHVIVEDIEIYNALKRMLTNEKYKAKNAPTLMF